MSEVGDSMKKDFNKDPWHLLPWDAVGALVKVIAFGAKKYEPRGWESNGGMEYSRLFSATQRHLTAWFNGEKQDSDTGYSHLWHAGTCILFLIAYEIRGIGKDDRPHAKAPTNLPNLGGTTPRPWPKHYGEREPHIVKFTTFDNSFLRKE